MRCGTFTPIIATLCAGVLLSLGGVASGATLSIASVDIQAVLDGSVAGKAALKKMQATAEKEKKLLQKKLDALQKMQKELETQKMMMRPETLDEKSQELQRKKREFDLYSRDTQANFQRKQGKVMRELYQGVRKVVASYAKDKKYTLIIEKSATSASGPVFVYADPAIEVTQDIIRRFDLATGK